MILRGTVRSAYQRKVIANSDRKYVIWTRAKLPLVSGVLSSGRSVHKFRSIRIILHLTDHLPEVNNASSFFHANLNRHACMTFPTHPVPRVNVRVQTFLPGNGRRCAVVTHGTVWLPKNVLWTHSAVLSSFIDLFPPLSPFQSEKEHLYITVCRIFVWSLVNSVVVRWIEWRVPWDV